MHDGEPKYVLDVLQHGDPTKIKNGLSIKKYSFLGTFTKIYCEFMKRMQNYVQ